ncbi:hypothetical protein BC827DRAFT_525383 [Russula dissimulans]|nr:hypothetical protein BC827DRAFT_525383 [Russula dissimulans]
MSCGMRGGPLAAVEVLLNFHPSQRVPPPLISQHQRPTTCPSFHLLSQYSHLPDFIPTLIHHYPRVTTQGIYIARQFAIMPKDPQTSLSPDDEPRYLTVVHPYPLNANLMLLTDIRTLAHWVACCTGKGILSSMFHKPSEWQLSRRTEILMIDSTFCWERTSGLRF